MEKEKCVSCKKDFKEGLVETRDGLVCATCRDAEYVSCRDCHDIVNIDNTRDVGFDDAVCMSCFEDNYFTCDGCGNDLPNDDYDSDGLCVRCVERDEDGEELMRDNEIQYKRPDVKTNKHQSDEQGDIIKSKRKFGLEFEMVNDEIENLNKLSRNIDETHGVGRDGSIQGGYGIEIQTPILGGAKGERAVVETLATVRGHGFKVNKTCGTHCHLDAKDFVPEYKERLDVTTLLDLKNGYLQDTTGLARIVAVIIDADVVLYSHIGNAVRYNNIYGFEGQEYTKEFQDVEKISYTVKGDNVVVTGAEKGDGEILGRIFSRVVEPVFDGTTKNFSVSYKMSDRYTKNKVVCMVNGNEAKRLARYLQDADLGDRKLANCLMCVSRVVPLNNTTEKLKRLLAFYTVFDDVVLAMLTPSRRSNEFCAPVKNRYNIADIMSIRSQEDFEKLWYRYRGRRGTNGGSDRSEIHDRKQDHHDSTRYVGVNIHSLFEDTKTIEIRYHSGTLDANKILHWVALHQHILDTISGGGVSLADIMKANAKIKLENKVDDFCKVLKLPDYLRQYVNGRINAYNK